MAHTKTVKKVRKLAKRSIKRIALKTARKAVKKKTVVRTARKAVKTNIRKVGKVLFALAKSVPRTMKPDAMYHDDNDYSPKIHWWAPSFAAERARILKWRLLGRLAN